jgi:hypothetical protein
MAESGSRPEWASMEGGRPSERQRIQRTLKQLVYEAIEN